MSEIERCNDTIAKLKFMRGIKRTRFQLAVNAIADLHDTLHEVAVIAMCARLWRIGLVLCLALSSCASIPRAVSDAVNLDRILGGDNNTVPTRVPVAPTPVPANLSTAGVVTQRSSLRVGVRFDAPPLSSVNAEGNLEGMDIDLARELARRWLGSNRQIEFVQVTSVTAPEKIRTREIDLAMGGLAQTRNAEEFVDFSLPYFEDGEAILTRSGAFTQTRSLARQTVQYVDFPTVLAMRDLQERAGFTLTLLSNVSYPRAMQDLRQGRAVGVAGNWRRLRIEAQRDPQFQVLSVIQRDAIAIMLPEAESDWTALVNSTLAAMAFDGFLAETQQKWFRRVEFTPTLPAGIQPLTLGSLNASRSPVADGLARWRDARALRVGWLPGNDALASANKQNVVTGFEVDLAREMARRWFGNTNAITFTQISAVDAPQLLSSDRIDLVLGGLPLTFSSRRLMEQSTPTLAPSAAITRGLSIQGDIGFGTRINDSDRRDLVNLTLQDMVKDGTYATIFSRWFGKATPPALTVWRGDFNPIADLAR